MFRKLNRIEVNFSPILNPLLLDCSSYWTIWQFIKVESVIIIIPYDRWSYLSFVKYRRYLFFMGFWDIYYHKFACCANLQTHLSEKYGTYIWTRNFNKVFFLQMLHHINNLKGKGILSDYDGPGATKRWLL